MYFSNTLKNADFWQHFLNLYLDNSLQNNVLNSKSYLGVNWLCTVFELINTALIIRFKTYNGMIINHKVYNIYTIIYKLYNHIFTVMNMYLIKWTTLNIYQKKINRTNMKKHKKFKWRGFHNSIIKETNAYLPHNAGIHDNNKDEDYFIFETPRVKLK